MMESYSLLDKFMRWKIFSAQAKSSEREKNGFQTKVASQVGKSYPK